MRAARAAAAGAVWLFTAAVSAPPTPAPEDLAKLAAWPVSEGFHQDRFGCYVPNVAAPAVPARKIPPPGPRVEPTTVVTTNGRFTSAVTTGQTPLAYHLWRAEYALQEHHVQEAIAEYRIAAQTPQPQGMQPNYIDFIARVPLSVTLYRAGDVSAARAEWSTMLRNRATAAKRGQSFVPDPPSVELLAQRRLDALAERAFPSWDPGQFTVGAGQHVVRGNALARKRSYDAAAAEWRTAARCSPRFQAPHLLLGYYAFLKGNATAARTEWIAALEGVEIAPGDMAGITTWQYDAMAALLRYTEGG